MVVEGGDDTWQVVRSLMGVTNPREAAPGTIRGDLALETSENLVHGSDGPESAAREIALFFPNLALSEVDCDRAARHAAERSRLACARTRAPPWRSFHRA